MRRLLLLTALFACGPAPGAQNTADDVLYARPGAYAADPSTPRLEASRAAPKITVLTFNVRWDDPDATGAATWAHRRAGAVAIIEAADADLVGTQEATRRQANDLEAALPAYTRVSVATKRAPEQHDSLLFFRKDRYTLIESHHFWLSTTPDVPRSDDLPRETPGHGPRSVSCALLRGHDGRQLVFCNTHFDGDRRVNEASARIVTARLQTRYPGRSVVLTGDFNALPFTDATWDEAPAWAAPFYSDTYAHLTARYVDAQAALQPEHPARMSCPKSECFEDAVRIDWVLTSRDLEPIAARTMSQRHEEVRVTDHWPIVVTLRPKRSLPL
ncbi:MAG: endonuclease/exonuclease/phosphatase family protein [Deltaproteobacteria bacterium]